MQPLIEVDRNTLRASNGKRRSPLISTHRTGFASSEYLMAFDKIHKRQFKTADVDGERRQCIHHSDLHAPRVSHFSHLPRSFSDHGSGRDFLHNRVVPIVVHPGDGLELLRQLDQMSDAPLDGFERPPRSRRIQVRLAEQNCRAASGWRHSCAAMRANRSSRSR
jgi:hypothetical protein